MGWVGIIAQGAQGNGNGTSQSFLLSPTWTKISLLGGHPQNQLAYLDVDHVEAQGNINVFNHIGGVISLSFPLVVGRK